MAARREAGAGSPCGPATAVEPWREAWAGLQRNCQQFGANLLKVQRRVSAQLAQPRTAARAAVSAPVASLSQAAAGWGGGRGSAGGVSREEVGRATWTFLHTLAAQYPAKPTRQQQRDARELIDILTRMYPCGECARHFRDLVSASPPAVATHADFSRWMCEAHNSVNRQLGKPAFNCTLVEARWAGIECGEDGGSACSLDFGRRR